MLVKDDYSKFIYSIDVNNSVEYICESVSTVSGRLHLCPPPSTAYDCFLGVMRLTKCVIASGLHEHKSWGCIPSNRYRMKFSRFLVLFA